METISIIVSCYNEEQALPLFYEEITKQAKLMSEVNFEFLFVNDGSKDNTIKILREFASKDSRVKYVSFSRNFGKEAAMYAGLENATGDYLALMDADLQDPPHLLPEMLQHLKDGYDVAATRRVTRKGEPIIRSFFARKFYKIINKLSDVEMVDGARDYRLMKRVVAQEIVNMREYNRYTKGIFSFVGFDTKWIEYENIDRVAGETKWSFFGLVKYAFNAIISFTTKPLSLASIFGVISCLISFIFVIVIVVRTILYGDEVAGWPSLMCVILFLGGLQFFCIGILGQYLSKNYMETKSRPIYIVKERNND